MAHNQYIDEIRLETDAGTNYYSIHDRDAYHTEDLENYATESEYGTAVDNERSDFYTKEELAQELENAKSAITHTEHSVSDTTLVIKQGTGYSRP